VDTGLGRCAVEKSQIHPGEEYGVREPPKRGVELQHVRVIEPVRAGKWRVEWIDPNPGLLDFVKSVNIVVSWRERRAFLRDEQHEGLLEGAIERSGFPGDEHPIVRAVETVIESTGEPELSVWRGVFEYDPDALERVASRAGIKPPEHLSGYADRHGRHRLPWECALELAEAFAHAEPRTVLDSIDMQESEMANEVRFEGRTYLAGLLTEYRAAWAIVRLWAGHDVAVAIREERIRKLERLLSDIRWDLKRPEPDLDRIVRRIERSL